MPPIEFDAVPGGVASVSGTLRQRLRRGVVWSLTGSVFNQGSTFAVSVLVANLLGRESFGKYALIQGTAVMLTNLAQAAIGYTATRYVAELRSRDPARAGRVLALCVAASLICAVVAGAALLLGAPMVAREALHLPSLAPELRIMAGTVLFGVLNGLWLGALAGLESYRAVGVGGIISGTAYVLLCGGGAHLFGLRGASIGLAVSAFLQCLVLAQFVRKSSRLMGLAPDFGRCWEERLLLRDFAAPAALSGALLPLSMWIGTALLARGQGSAVDVALFSSSNSLRLLILFIPMISNGVALSLLSHERGLGHWPRYRRLFFANMGLTIGLVVLGAVGLLLAGRHLLAFFGPTFDAAYPTLVILVISTIPEGLTAAVYQVVQTESAMWRSLLLIVLPRDAVLMLLSFALVGDLGARGLAYAYLVAWCVALSAACILSRRLWPAPVRFAALE